MTEPNTGRGPACRAVSLILGALRIALNRFLGTFIVLENVGNRIKTLFRDSRRLGFSSSGILVVWDSHRLGFSSSGILVVSRVIRNSPDTIVED